MQRLNDETLAAFLAEPGPALILFGADSGQATLAQAEHFALLWAEGQLEARFGYIDATCCDAARRAWAIRVLPTTLLLEGGVERRRFEGVHARHHIEAAAQRPPARGLAA